MQRDLTVEVVYFKVTVNYQLPGGDIDVSQRPRLEKRR